MLQSFAKVLLQSVEQVFHVMAKGEGTLGRFVLPLQHGLMNLIGMSSKLLNGLIKSRELIVVSRHRVS